MSKWEAIIEIVRQVLSTGVVIAAMVYMYLMSKNDKGDKNDK